MTPDDLLAFLAAVHDADEQVARQATPGDEQWTGDGDYLQLGDDEANAKYVGSHVHHIARHDPQSVLARAEAERALVALHPRVGDGEQAMCRTCADAVEWGADREGEWPCPTLRALAWGYRHREGWQESWRPDGVEVGA